MSSYQGWCTDIAEVLNFACSIYILKYVMLHIHVIGAKKEILELTVCSADCDKEFCGPEMFVCWALCWSRAQFHIAKQHFCLVFLFYMTDPWTNPVSAYLTGRRVGGNGLAPWDAGTLPWPSFLAEKCNRLRSAGGKTASVGKVVPL